jgi:protein transport protein SEC23
MNVWSCSLCGSRNRAAVNGDDVMKGLADGINGIVLDDMNDDTKDDYEVSIQGKQDSFVLVIDLYTPVDQFDSLIEEIINSLCDIKGEICIVTVDNHCHIRDPVFSSRAITIISEADPIEVVPFSNDMASTKNYLKMLKPIVHNNKTRPERATGLTLSTVSKIAKDSIVVMFIAGPCTTPPGQIVSMEKSKHMRSFKEIYQNLPSIEFYRRLGLHLNVFISCMDQAGAFEMDPESIMLCDSYNTELFKQSYKKFIQEVNIAEVSIISSKQVAVRGFLSPGVTKSTGEIHDEAIGKPGDCIKLSMVKDHAIGIVFHMDTVGLAKDKKSVPKEVYVQLISRCNNRLRITTFRRPTTNSGRTLIQGFDQETWISLLMKQYCFYESLLKSFDYVEKFISLYKLFASPSNKSALPQEFNMLPFFQYHLSRSYLDKIHKTPDEWRFYSLSFLRLGVEDCVKVIYPLLTEHGSKQELPLVSSSIKAGVVMDSFFHVVKCGVPETTEKVDDITEIYPLPRYVHCQPGDSQSRFLTYHCLDGFDEWWRDTIRLV